MKSRALLASLLTLAVLAAAIAAPAEPSRITGLSASFLPDRVRLVVDFQGSAPAFDVAFRPADTSVAIDLRGIEASTVTPPACGPDPLVADWTVSQPNFTSLLWLVRLEYPVPADAIKIASTPAQITVEVRRGFDETSSITVTRGVEWRRREVRSARGYVLINELELDPRRTTLDIVHAKGSLQSVDDPADIARQRGALAFINGGFFSAKAGSLGIVVEDGKVLKPHVAHRPPRTTLGITSDGRVLMDRVAVKDDRLVPTRGSWSDVVTALGAGPRLIADGKVDITAKDEGLGPGANDITRRCARSAVAVLKSGRLLLITVSGYRDNHSQGWSLEELAAWLVQRGARDAMGLDGGGSTAMVLDGRMVSRTWAHRGAQRKVANGIAVIDGSTRLMPGRVQMKVSRERIAADGESSVKVTAKVFTATGAPVADGTVVYFSTTAGRITARASTRKGVAVGWWRSVRQPGESRILAWCGLAVGEQALVLEAGPPAHMAARVVELPSAVPVLVPTPAAGPVPTPAPRRMLEVVVTDRAGNPIPNENVRVQASTASQLVRTGPDGVARMELSQDDAGGMVRVSRDGLSPLEIGI